MIAARNCQELERGWHAKVRVSAMDILLCSQTSRKQILEVIVYEI